MFKMFGFRNLGREVCFVRRVPAYRFKGKGHVTVFFCFNFKKYNSALWGGKSLRFDHWECFRDSREDIILVHIEDANWYSRTSESPTHFATDMNGNNLIMCSCVMNVRLGYLKREGLFVDRNFFLFFFIFFWYEALFELYHLLSSSSVEHIFIDLCFSTTRKTQPKNPAYSFTSGSSPVAFLALKALPIATLPPAQLP